MSTVERLLKATEEIWAGYHEKPFVRGLGDGTLDVKKFRRYIIQDYWYLMDYTKVFAVGVAKSKSVEVMKLFAKYIQAILDGEVNVHNGYMADFGITQEELDHTPIAQDNRSYTSYMLSVAYKGGEAEVLTAIFSCAYSYEVIARQIVAERPDAPDHPLYGRWVRGYITERYTGNNVILKNMLEQLTADYTEAQLRELEEETGYRCDHLEYLMSVNTTIAFCDEALDIFLARDLKKTHQHLDPDEEIEIEAWELSDLLKRIYAGELTDGKTVSAILAYACKAGQK